MDYESSDILGGRLQVSPQRSPAWSDPGQITLLLGLGLAAFYTWTRLAPHYRQWRETRYKKATRRRHGIPDDDNRPFNVAYAAALHARKQRDGKGSRPYLREEPVVSAEEDGVTAADTALPLAPSFVKWGGYTSEYPPGLNGDAIQSSLGPRTSIPTIHLTSHQERTSHTSLQPVPNGSAAHNPKTSGVKQPLVTRTSHGKHALDDEADSEPEMLAKKSRVEGEDLIDGDEQAEWHGSDEDMEVDEAQPVKRGSKRVASSEDDEGLDLQRTARRDKRARKVSLDKSPQSPDENMDEDVTEGAEDLEDVVRGKKRDRVEAGSTFGGDDYIVDGDNGEQPKRRRRKGRTSHKLEASPTRGQKRGRGSQSQESDESDSEQPRQKSMRKKRGRKSQEGVVPVSNDPLCKGRRIGEEWECNGVLFKVGPNGQRLRQELIKKSRSKFPMPSDSQHPDRRAHVDVYVEVWLSEEEYQLAKERHELAWQDSSPTPSEPQTPRDVPESPSKLAGKNLLWSSTISSRESPVKRGPLRQSVTTNAASRTNIFPPSPVVLTRRISSVYHAPASPAAEGPALQKTKSYSKWEKQDLEAAAMSKIRDRQQAARASDTPKALPSSASAPSTTTSSSNTAPSLFSISSTTPATNKAPEKPSGSGTTTFSFAPSSGNSASTASKSSTSELPKINTTPAPSTTSTDPSKPPPTFSFAPSAPATSNAPDPQPVAPQTSSSIPNFFAKPSAPTTSTPATSAPSASSSSIPNFFAKPAAQGPTPTTTTATTPASASGTSKPSFSFGPTPAQQAGNSPAPLGNATNDPAKGNEQSKAAPGTSLLSRLGMGPPPSSQPANAPTFSFAKPESTTSAAASTSNAAKAPAAAAAAAVSSAPKFNFGVSSKPASASTTPIPAANAPPVSGILPAPGSSSTPASSTPKFSFGVTNSNAQPATSSTSAPANPFGTSSAAAASSAAKSPFSFGATSTPGSNSSPFSGATTTASPFGAALGTSATASPFGVAASNATKPSDASKSAFGFGTTSSGTLGASPFGAASNIANKPAEPAKSAFSLGGNTSSSIANPSPFGAPASGASSSPFGVPAANSTLGAAPGSAAKADGAPKSAFSFGNTTSSTSSASPFGTAQKADSQASKPVFGFSAPSTSTPTFGSTSTPAGQPSKPTFGFGAPANVTAASSATPASGSTTSGTENKASFSFNFGQSSTTANSGSTPAASGSAFGGFGSQPAGGSNAAPAASPFGAPASGQQGTNAFGFGAPSGGAFSFGSNSGQGQQKIKLKCCTRGPRARKSTLLTFAPLHRDSVAPPHAPPLEEMILDSPVTVTTHLMNAAAKSADSIGPPGTLGVEDWMNEKSREELSELLLKAGGIIKSRESELTVTAELCKSLYSDNVTLKAKHEALLARLPSSGSTPVTSPPASQMHLDIPSIDPPSFASVASPASPDPPSQPISLAARYRRARRVSVTPAELASLSDQNAELIEKLEKLESESLKADQAGKRKLRKLEEEIQTLRDELEKMQARGIELEQQARAATNAVTAQKRKEEREARLQALKDRSTSQAAFGSAPDEVKDFAPPNYLPRSSPVKRTASNSSAFAGSSLSGSDYSAAHSPSNACLDEDDPPLPADPASYFPTPPGSSVDLPPAEYAIVAQLLSKIRELEETNVQIKEQQTLTEERVRATQFDVESIRRVYEFLDDGDVDLEIQEEDLDVPRDPGSPSPADYTIRFSSLRRSIAGSMSNLLNPPESDVFAGGITRDMQSTVQGAIANRVAHSKARKTVVGLFDSDADASVDSAGWGEYPPMLKVSPAFRPPSDVTPAWSSAATEGGLTPLSPSLSASQSPVDGLVRGRSLGSELGSDYGDDWAQGGINHHLRASSLYDLTGLASSPVSPSASAATLPPITLSAVEEDHATWDKPDPSTPPRAPLQLNVEPPTPTPEKARSPASKQRQLQLSQTVRARTNRWIEGRFPQSASWQDTSDGVEPSLSVASTSSLGRRSSAFFRNVHPEVLGETFDNIAGRIRRVASNGAFSPPAFASGVSDVPPPAAEPVRRKEEDEACAEADRSVTVRKGGSVADPLAGQHEGLVGYVIEAWLWLQFVVVVALFLWTMAKRGPKVVLEAERRNAHRPSTSYTSTSEAPKHAGPASASVYDIRMFPFLRTLKTCTPT
ncbi:hypothetical protein BD309DRAFT_864512 [Dichomitus squalens]|uniref:Uncharacterized protein n=1 Tax=Dichomitus squalens TaxID=114155 RepID=A0A4Q9Q8Y3_9APHY|nr:hypothetical protein BD309DRAFT_864512 [Dichomitus squalens]TBU64057.1 hypothetical protein BD310DRAFT_807688 [Dichomitus squalens]